MFSNYKIFALVLFFAILSNISYSEDWIFHNRFEVGFQPVAVVIDSSGLIPQSYIICYGIDQNYNDIYEEGDEYPSLWKLSIGFTTGLYSFSDVVISKEKVRDFPFGSIGIPFRPAIDKDTLYICQLGKISSYLLTGQELGEITYRKNAVALSKKNNQLFISVRESLDTNYVLVYDLQNRIITDSIPAYTMVQQTLPIGDTLLAILCEGNWGLNDSKLLIAKVDDIHEILHTIVIGNGGNHITYHNNLLAVTTGDNMLLVYNIQEEKVDLVKSINLPTSGFDGVRESLFFSDSIIYTSSWDSHIYISDLSGSMPKFLDAKGKAEGFAIANFDNIITFFIITNQFVQGTYQPDNKIVLYTDIPITFIEEKETKAKTRLYPNPIQEIGYLVFENTFPDNILRAEVYNILGEFLGNAEIIHNTSGNNLAIKFTNLNLKKGIYNLRIFTNGYQKTIMFIKE